MIAIVMVLVVLVVVVALVTSDGATDGCGVRTRRRGYNGGNGAGGSVSNGSGEGNRHPLTCISSVYQRTTHPRKEAGNRCVLGRLTLTTTPSPRTRSLSDGSCFPYRLTFISVGYYFLVEL